MRAGAWSTIRDIVAAQTSWRRARDVADRLPADSPELLALQIAPRTLLSATAIRVGGSGAETGFDELRTLCERAGDKRSLAIGMTGLVAQALLMHDEAAIALADEHLRLLESIGDPDLTVGLFISAFATKVQCGDARELLRLADRVIALADGDASKGNLVFGSPLAMAHAFRGTARWMLGIPSWKDDYARAIALARESDVATLAGAMFYTYLISVPWIVPADEEALRLSAEALDRAERSGDDVAVIMCQCARSQILLSAGGRHADAGRAMLAHIKDAVLHERFSHSMLGAIDTSLAAVMARAGDLDGAIELARSVIDNHLWPSGEGMWALTTGALVQPLLERGADGDVEAAEAAIDRMAGLAVADVTGFRIHELRLRAMLARAKGNVGEYRELADRYLAQATSLGFHGHIAAAEAMTRELT